MITIFILPPSIRELRKRLERRAQDSKQTIEMRLKNARIEMEHWQEYDYVLVNEDLDQSCARVRSILAAARQKRDRFTQMESFVRDLQGQIDSL
jgi:guanylate kinase